LFHGNFSSTKIYTKERIQSPMKKYSIKNIRNANVIGKIQEEPVDRWTFLHFLMAFGMTLLFYYFTGDKNLSLVSMIIIIVSWEVFEWGLGGLPGIHRPESLGNQLTDIFIGIVGALTAFLLFIFPPG
jgi:hypothetical protein